MPNKKFEFSSRVSLILGNLKTVREVVKILKEKDGEGQLDIKKLIKFIKDHLKEGVPEIKQWEVVIKNNCICTYPANEWSVFKDTISIIVDFDQAMVLYRPDQDPYVGLYVPKKWSLLETFNKRLIKELGSDFMNDWDEPEEEYPIWTYVKYENYAMGDHFDVNGFLDNIFTLVSKLARKKDVIDRILKQIQKNSG